MNRRFPILRILLAYFFSLGLSDFGVSLWADMAEEQLQSTFVNARDAYDQEDFATAVKHYESILQAGHYSPAVFYNLGNAHFRGGDFGKAILSYKRAEVFHPLDSPTRANISFAQKQAGATIPPASPIEIPFRIISTAQWTLMLTVLYWITFITIAIYLLCGRPVRLRKVLPTVIGILFISGVGFAGNRHFTSQQEAVILSDTVNALFAPLENSEKHFNLQIGSVVKVKEESGTWLKIQSGQEKGWITKSSCEMVIPWNEY